MKDKGVAGKNEAARSCFPTFSRHKKMCSQKITSRDGKTRVKYAKTLEMINPHAAGLDLHKEKIWACASKSI